MKGHIVVNEMPRNLLRCFRTQCGKKRFRLGILGMNLSLDRLLLTVVHVALHVVMQMEKGFAFQFFADYR